MFVSMDSENGKSDAADFCQNFDLTDLQRLLKKAKENP